MITKIISRSRSFLLIGCVLQSSILGFGQKGIDLKSYQEKHKNNVGVVLNHTQTITISVNSKTNELDIFETDYEEILYLKKSARFFTEQSITLSDFFEDLVSISATVIKPDGKTIKLKPIDFVTVDSPPSSWVFHDDDKEVIFDLKELNEGYRTIIQYTKKIKRPEFFDIFHFVSGYPVDIAKVIITYQPDVDITFYERAFHNYKPVINESVDKKGMRTKSWEITNIPAYKSEPGSTALNNHLPHVFAQIKSYKTKSGETKKLIGSVEDLYNFFVEFLLLKDDESNRKEINDVVRSLIAEKSTDYEKMDTIFSWVQTNIKYIAFEDGINGYVPRSCSSVMKNRYGDCKDMANLLVEMLTFAKVKNAYVAWVGTKSLPFQMSEIPSPLTCNHVICVVEKEEGGYYYLDATGSEMGFLNPPDEIQEKELLIHKGKGKYELFKVPAVEAEKNYFKTKLYFTLGEGDSIRGRGIDFLGGYERESRSYDLKNSDPEDLYDYIKDICLGGRNRFYLKEYELFNVDNNNEELRINYEFSLDNTMIQHNGEYFFNPVFFKPRLTQYSKEDYKFDRKKNHHRWVEYDYIFTIPQGYSVKHIPENTNFEHELFGFSATYALEGDVLTVNMRYYYRLMTIPPDLFDEWNEFSNQINKATIQNIILVKN